MSIAPPIVKNGWALYAHPLFLEQVDALIQEVEAFKRKDPANYTRKNSTKRLAAIAKLAFEIIPEDPTRFEYRQGDALGEKHKHWFRAVFFQQYRLFFRYHAKKKVIVYAWVNDSGTKRAYESPQDAYRVFRKMLEAGNPPDDFEGLMAVAAAEGKKLRSVTSRLTE